MPTHRRQRNIDRPSPPPSVAPAPTFYDSTPPATGSAHSLRTWSDVVGAAPTSAVRPDRGAREDLGFFGAGPAVVLAGRRGDPGRLRGGPVPATAIRHALLEQPPARQGRAEALGMGPPPAGRALSPAPPDRGG